MNNSRPLVTTQPEIGKLIRELRQVCPWNNLAVYNGFFWLWAAYRLSSDLQIILQLAKDSGGSVSVADCVIATGNSVGEVKKTLGMLCAQEVMAIDNHHETGSIIYNIV